MPTLPDPHPGGDGLLITLCSPVPGTGSREVLDHLLAEHRRRTPGASA